MANKSVTVLGWYGHGNCGDEAYKLAFPAVFPGYDFTFTEEIREEHRKSGAVILGGGDIAYSHMLDRVQRVVGRKHLMSVSLSSSDCVGRIGKVFETVAVRDQSSLDKLKMYDVAGDYYPDVVFALKGDREAGLKRLRAMFAAERREMYKQVVIVVVNAYLAVRENLLARDAVTFEKMAHDLGYLADNTPASFVFVPFGFDAPHDDRIANGWAASKCKFWKKNLVVFDKLSPMETLDLFCAADAAVVSRLHAGIYSTMAGVPFIDLTHHDKTRSFMATHGLADWSRSYWSFDKADGLSLLHDHLKSQGSRDRLAEVTARCRGRLAELGKTKLV